MKYIKIFFTLTLFILVLPYCGSDGKDDKEGDGSSKKEDVVDENQILKWSIGQGIENIDPAHIIDTGSMNVAVQIFEGLMGYDPETGQPVNNLAEKITNKNFKEFNVTLRKDLTWSDGSPLTIDDVLYSWFRILEPATGSKNVSFFFLIKGAKTYYDRKNAFNKKKAGAKEPSKNIVGIKKIDDLQMKIILEQPVPYFSDLLAFTPFAVVPKSIINKYGKDWVSKENINNGNLISSGPFKLIKWDTQYFELIRNPKYYDAKNVKLERAKIYTIEDADIHHQLYKADKLDAIRNIPNLLIPSMFGDQTKEIKLVTFQGGKNKEAYKTFTLSSYYLNLNTKRFPFNNVNVRRALNMAINKKELVDTVTRMQEPIMNNVVPKAITRREGSFEALQHVYKWQDHNPEDAKKLIDAFIKQNGLKRFPLFTFLTRPEERDKAIAQYIQDQWKKHLGIDCSIEYNDFQTYISKLQTHKYEVARGSWGADYNDPLSFLELYTSDSPTNFSNYENKEYDVVFQKILDAVNIETRNDLLNEAEKILLKDMVIVPLITPPLYFMKKDRIKGWNHLPRDLTLLKTVSIKEKNV